jgi:hypothetical protein
MGSSSKSSSQSTSSTAANSHNTTVTQNLGQAALGVTTGSGSAFQGNVTYNPISDSGNTSLANVGNRILTNVGNTTTNNSSAVSYGASSPISGGNPFTGGDSPTSGAAGLTQQGTSLGLSNQVWLYLAAAGAIFGLFWFFNRRSA